VQQASGYGRARVSDSDDRTAGVSGNVAKGDPCPIKFASR
jgi:hypothetical protein